MRGYIAFAKKRDLLLEVGAQVAREDVPELIERLSDTKKVLLFKNLKKALPSFQRPGKG